MLLTLLLVAPLLGLLGVVAAEVVPDGRIAAQLVRATDLGELRGDDRSLSLLGTTVDHYAECTAVTIGLGDPAGNVLRRTLYSPASFGCDSAEYLERFAATGELAPARPYMRYWHGYAVLTRPTLVVFGLSGTRWLAFGALALAVVAFARAVATRFGLLASAAFVVPALLTTDMIAGGWSVAQAIGLATAWAGGFLVLTQVGAEPRASVVVLSAALGGAISAYFDLMVAIPASVALCTSAAGLGLIGHGNKLDGAVVTRMAASVGGWLVGIGGMWFAKWVLAWLFVDRRWTVESVRTQIEFRTGGEHRLVTGTRLNGLIKNLAYWWDRPLTPLVVVATVGVVGLAVWRYHRAYRDTRRLAWLLAGAAVIAVPVALWYVVLNNHNQIHVWQTYRSIAVASGAIAGLLVAATSEVWRGEHGEGGDRTVAEPPEPALRATVESAR